MRNETPCPIRGRAARVPRARFPGRRVCASLPRAILLLGLLATAGCATGPEIIAGGESAVSITAGPLANADRMAERHCGSYGKRAEFVGSQPLGPQSTRRLYAYNCVGVVSGTGQRSPDKRR